MVSDQGARPFDRERTLQRLLSTEQVAERERFSYWREMTTEVFLDLRPERTTNEPFFGSITTGSLGDVRLAFVRSGAHRVHRSSAEIARSPQARYFVNFQLEGESSFAQRSDDPVRLATGDLAIVDCTQPFTLGFRASFCHFNIELPERVVRARFADPDRVGGRVVRGSEGVGTLVSGYLRAAASTVTRGDPVPRAIGEHVLDLLTIAFGAALDPAQAAPSLEDARRQAVHAYIERNLADAALSPSRIADDLKISTRYLHKLFEGCDESVMQRVLRRRLERCRSDLEDPRMRRYGIADIAFAWGFSDLSHFGRAFKTAFGATPREWRRRQS